MPHHTQHIVLNLKILTNLFSRRLEEGIRREVESPITAVQAQILGFFGRTRRKSIPQREIQKVFGIRGSTAANILRLMEQNNLIRRSPCPTDARQNKVTLTEKAEQLNKRSLAFFQEFEQTLTSGLSEEELMQFFAITEKLKKNLE